MVPITVLAKLAALDVEPLMAILIAMHASNLCCKIKVVVNAGGQSGFVTVFLAMEVVLHRLKTLCKTVTVHQTHRCILSAPSV